MKVKEFDEFSYTNRKPGLIFLIVVAIAVLLIVYVRRDRGEQQSKPEDRNTEQVVESGGLKSADGQANKPERDPRDPVSKPPPVGFKGRLAEADQRAEDGDLIEARSLYRELLGAGVPSDSRADLENRLGKIQIQLLLQPYMTPEKVEYVIRPGDSLDKISKKFGVTKELIQTSNGIKNPNLIRVGDRLRFIKGEFDIRVSKSRHELIVYLDDQFVKRYRVGTGKFDKTPVGTFEIYDKIPEPPWWRPDGKMIPYGHPENILGSHWMAIRSTGDTAPVRGYGIHGTTDDSSIGKDASAGCIRMHNPEVGELFTLVPIGTRVAITD